MSNNCQSMIRYPIQRLKKRRYLSEFSLKTNKYTNSLENLDIKKEDSQKKTKYNLITISNDNFYINNKYKSDIKIPEINFRNYIKSKYKKLTFFSINNRKKLLHQNNRKNIILNALSQNNKNNIKNKLNKNYEDNDKRKIKSYINNYELKNNNINKILRNIKNRNKYIIFRFKKY